MAIFSVMHLFAFSWRVYRISDDPQVGTEAGGAQRYKGGRLGIKAYLDAFNPWDILKAITRGFRWLFVGRRHRFEDPSYKGLDPRGNKLGSMDGSVSNEPVGTSVRKGSNQPPTEMVPGANRRTETFGTESDTAGLLAHAHNASPSRRDMSPTRADIGMQHTSPVNTSDQIPMPSAYGGYDNVGMHPGYGSPGSDTGYHAPSAAPSAGAPVGAAYGGQDEWNHWAGANRDDHPGGQSRR